MFGKKRFDTIVVGAGPTGMLAALVLAKDGMNVAIVDKAPRTCTSSHSALLHPSTLESFQRLGIVDRIVDEGYRIEKIGIFDGVALHHTLSLSELSIPFPFALSMPLSLLEIFLEEELEKAGVKVLWDHHLSELEEEELGISATIDRYSDRGTGYAVSHTERVIEKTLHFHATTIIAADGYNSILRRMAGAETFPLGEDQLFLSFDFETDRDHKHTASFGIAENLITAQQPLKGGMTRLLFQCSDLVLPSRNREKERSFLQDRINLPEYLEDANFNELLKKRVPWKTGYINRIRYRAAIPFKSRYLPNPRLGDVFFIGDAARSFGPVGSLSLNLGILEAERTANVIRKTSGDVRLRDEVLDSEAMKMVDNWKMLSNFGEFAIPNEGADRWLTANRSRILSSLPASGEALQRLANQLSLRLDFPDFATATR